MQDELRREVIRRAANGVRALAFFQLFRKSKVTDRDRAIRAQEQVFGFHVAIDIPGAVNVLQPEQDLRGVHFDLPNAG